MRDRVLRRLLRSVLTLSVAAPLASGVACGGRTTNDKGNEDDGGGQADAPGPDGRTVDTGLPDSSLGCEGQGCGAYCGNYCTASYVCNDGVLTCGCVCPPQEASVVDEGPPDAPDPCHPNPNECPYDLPYSCIDAAIPDAAIQTTEQCQALCDFPDNSGGWCNLGTSNGQPVVECYASCGVGRRTLELGAAPRKRGSVVGRYLAAAARLEAGSVHAFRRLGRELAAHGAPARLQSAALRAARDEGRHARDTSKLARAHGVKPAMPRDRLRGDRSLRAIAVENAVEGCVRETYGALVALYQAESAKEPAVARLMRRLAADEVRHAALSWQVAGWVDGKLTAADRAHVERAKRTAVKELRTELKREPPAALVAHVGLPDAKMATRLLGTMLATLETRGRGRRTAA